MAQRILEMTEIKKSKQANVLKRKAKKSTSV